MTVDTNPAIEAATDAPEAADMKEPPKVAVTPCGDLWPAPYYYDGGLRRVKPYHYTYNTYCKERWRGRTLEEIFTSEFRDRRPEYYVCSPICLFGPGICTN